MDIEDGNPEDNLRISFILGSALREGDTDRFLNVYDNLVPKNKQQVTFSCVP